MAERTQDQGRIHEPNPRWRITTRVGNPLPPLRKGSRSLHGPGTRSRVVTPIETLARLAGEWRGSNTLHESRIGRFHEYPSTLSVTPVVAGRFVRIDYSWIFQHRPQEG